MEKLFKVANNFNEVNELLQNGWYVKNMSSCRAPDWSSTATYCYIVLSNDESNR